MSWYDFGHRYAEFDSCLPDGKTTIDTGLYYQELIVIGGWYYAPIPGSGQTRFYNRLYLNPSKEDKDLFDLDERASSFINLSKTKFGVLETKFPDWGYVYNEDGEPVSYETTPEERAAEVMKWKEWYQYITDKVKKSWIVVYPENRHDVGLLFDSFTDASHFSNATSRSISGYMLKKYGIQIYEPHTERPFNEIWSVV